MSAKVSAILFDGARSRGVPVVLESDGHMLTVSGRDSDEVLTAALPDIDIEPPLAGMARQLDLGDGRTLEVEDGPELRQWFHQRGTLERFVNWLEARWPVAIASLALTSVVVWALYSFALPATASVVARNMPHSWEASIADGSVTLLRQLGFFKSDIPLERQQAIRARFAPLVDALPDADRYQLEFRRTLYFGPNAFALPGGRMVVLDDLIDLTENNDEIVGVLAHELGHAYNRHAMRNALQSSFLGIIVAVTLGDTSTLASIPLIGLQATHTRKFEREADAFAAVALKQADISPAVLARMFEKLRDHFGLDGDDETWLSSHPALNDRIRAADEAAAGGAFDDLETVKN